MTTKRSSIDALRLELRRGSLVLAVLGALRVERYGYTLRTALAGHGIDIDEGALYPMLRRLESQGLLRSEWRESENRRKRFYRLTAAGAEVLAELESEWSELNASLRRLLREVDDGTSRALSEEGRARTAARRP
jgi:PadR family transcriptional regulator, regulatory protein PadR